MESKPIYFDHAATTPLDPVVLEAMMPYLIDEYANPSSIYGAARQVRGAIEAARHSISSLLGAKPTEIIFTSGATESINAAIQGVLRAHPGARWITSAIEHDAVLAQVKSMGDSGHAATVVPVQPNGIVSAADVAAAITDETVLISLMMANNEIGTIQPVAEVARLVAAVRVDRVRRQVLRPLYLHTDATQAAGYLNLQVTRLGVDLLTFNGSKIYGPKGSGALYIRTGTHLESLIFGGGQERGRRSGTEHVAGIIGLAAAFKLAAQQRDAEVKRLTTLRNYAYQELARLMPNIILNGDARHRLPNNLNFTIPGADGESMVLYLDNVGIMASTGSACSTGNLDPSHVLLAIGRSVQEADASLRLTFGRVTTEQNIARLIDVLPPIVSRLQAI